ncbi:hypothetical protein HELRODRAFT_125204, partial [Helobdella robusta]|uniref:Uncharacterized protein n=1 Tax=Helobdella robusta TaxID=6412 RepID=T1EH49_HELRO
QEHYDIAFLLIDSGAKLNSHKCRWDRSPIHLAALRGNVRLIAKLIKKCPDLVHSRCHFLHQTPLLCASMTNHVKAIKLLLSLNADVNAKDVYGKTSLAKSVEKRCTKAILCLLRHGADPNMKDEEGRTCLFFPSLSHDVKMVDLILSHTTIDVNARDFLGKTALHQAC